MSLRRFNGWEPEEIHVHLDAAGNETGRTIVTREPEWDDEQRETALALDEYESALCPNCGGHLGKAMDPTLARDVEHEPLECLDCKAIAQTRHAQHVAEGHKDDGPCACDKHVTWISKYLPIEA